MEVGLEPIEPKMAGGVGVELGRAVGAEERGLVRVEGLDLGPQPLVPSQRPLLVVPLGGDVVGVGADAGAQRLTEATRDGGGAALHRVVLNRVGWIELGAILGPAVSGGVVTGPKPLEQSVERYRVGVEPDPHRFGVIADVVVGRGGGRSSGVADLGPVNTVETPEPGVGTPESAQRKREAAQRVGTVAFDGWQHGEILLVASMGRRPRPETPRVWPFVSNRSQSVSGPGIVVPRALVAGQRDDADRRGDVTVDWSASQDVLSAFVDAAGLRGVVLATLDLQAPWRVGNPMARPPVLHAVVEGRAMLSTEHVARPVRLGAGDVAMLPAGGLYELTDRVPSKAPPLPEAEQRFGDAGCWVRYGGRGTGTRMMCYRYRFVQAAALASLQMLPPLIVVRALDEAPGLHVALAELARAATYTGVGRDGIVGRLAGVAYLSVLRHYFEHTQEPQRGLLADSGAIWALVPETLGHRFRPDLGTDSGAPGRPFRAPGRPFRTLGHRFRSTWAVPERVALRSAATT